MCDAVANKVKSPYTLAPYDVLTCVPCMPDTGASAIKSQRGAETDFGVQLYLASRSGPYMCALYVCLTCVPYMCALYVCLISVPCMRLVFVP